MPHLQLELTSKYPLSVKRDLAKRLGDLYGAIMQTTPDLVDVSFRELGEGNVWRCEAPGPVPSAVLICDIRAGRPPEQRARLGEALLNACVEALKLDPLHFGVEFTQHSGDEIYRSILVGWRRARRPVPRLESVRSDHPAGGKAAERTLARLKLA